MKAMRRDHRALVPPRSYGALEPINLCPLSWVFSIEFGITLPAIGKIAKGLWERL